MPNPSQKRKKKPQIPQETVYILPTRNGIIYMTGSIGVLAFGFFFQQDVIIFLSFCLAAFLFTGMFQTNRNMQSIRLSALEAAPLPANTHGEITLALVNRSKEVRFAHHIELEAGDSTFSGTLDALAPREARKVSVAIPPLRRGIYPLKSLRVYTVFPVGLFYAWKWMQVNKVLIVYPSPHGTREPVPVAAHPDDSGQSRQLQGEDFYGHRLYQKGDSQKHIDWKARSRGLPLMVKQFEDPLMDVRFLRWDDLTDPDPEARLSQLAQWVLECHQTNQPYALYLPTIKIPPGRGQTQLIACLKELARYAPA